MFKRSFFTRRSHLKKDINENDIQILKINIYNYKYKIVNIKFRLAQQLNWLADLKNDYFNHDFKNVLVKQINNEYYQTKKLLAFIIYIKIINALILESQEKEKTLFNYCINESLLYALKVIKETKKITSDNFNKNYYNTKSKDIITSLIPFYSENITNQKHNKALEMCCSDSIISKSNIFIGITRRGFIIIFSFNFYSNNLTIENKKNNINNKIFNIKSSLNLEQLSPLKIMRFEKCFNHKDYPNIFLVSFPSSGLKKMGCVKIVGILDDFSKITILNTFDYEIGLINAIEIKLNDNYYLLNCTNGFTLWFYDSNKNEIKYKRIIPKESNIDNKDDNNDTYKNFITYKKVFYIEKRNLLIAQVHLKSKILFYSINNENNEFNIIFQSQIDIDNETGNYFSDYHLNSCIIQDKYLLIGTKIKKEKKKIIIIILI